MYLFFQSVSVQSAERSETMDSAKWIIDVTTICAMFPIWALVAGSMWYVCSVLKANAPQKYVARAIAITMATTLTIWAILTWLGAASRGAMLG